MNADQLLALFNRISEAPDAVARLRRFVLDLAVRGKLVPQDPNDEPASELLKRVTEDKRKLIESGIVKEPKNFLQFGREELPFSPPSRWEWVRLIDIVKPTYGFAFSSNKFNAEKRGMPLIRIRDISSEDTQAYFEGEFDSAYIVEAGDLLVGMDGDFNLRRWKGKTGLLNQRVMRLNGWHSNAEADFVRIPLQFVLDHLHGKTSLTTVKHLSAKQVNGIEVPLPPLAEQRRIVAKVDELMALCDELEAAREAREGTRARLTAASLARLSQPAEDEKQFKKDAAFALDALPALTTRPDQIKQLRQTILNLAVRGKLVAQDPNDELASLNGMGFGAELEGRLNVNLPKNWQWVRVEDVANARLGKMLDKAKNKGRPYHYLRNTNVHWFEIRLDSIKTILLEDAEFSEYHLKSGDVLICEGGHGIGRTAVWRGGAENLVFQKALHRVRPGQYLDPDFFAYCCFVYFDTGVMQSYFTGVGIPHFTGRALAKLIFPLPPLAEQRRIVAKVEILMTLCDELEASLIAGDEIRRRLLNAVLHETLAPAHEKLEAAE